MDGESREPRPLSASSRPQLSRPGGPPRCSSVVLPKARAGLLGDSTKETGPSLPSPSAEFRHPHPHPHPHPTTTPLHTCAPNRAERVCSCQLSRRRGLLPLAGDTTGDIPPANTTRHHSPGLKGNSRAESRQTDALPRHPLHVHSAPRRHSLPCTPSLSRAFDATTPSSRPKPFRCRQKLRFPDFRQGGSSLNAPLLSWKTFFN